MKGIVDHRIISRLFSQGFQFAAKCVFWKVGITSIQLITRISVPFQLDSCFLIYHMACSLSTIHSALLLLIVTFYCAPLFDEQLLWVRSV